MPVNNVDDHEDSSDVTNQRFSSPTSMFTKNAPKTDNANPSCSSKSKSEKEKFEKKKQLETSIHVLEVYDDEKSQQTFQTKRQALQDFVSTNLKVAKEGKEGAFHLSVPVRYSNSHLQRPKGVVQTSDNRSESWCSTIDTTRESADMSQREEAQRFSKSTNESDRATSSASYVNQELGLENKNLGESGASFFTRGSEQFVSVCSYPDEPQRSATSDKEFFDVDEPTAEHCEADVVIINHVGQQSGGSFNNLNNYQQQASSSAWIEPPPSPFPVGSGVNKRRRQTTSTSSAGNQELKIENADERSGLYQRLHSKTILGDNALVGNYFTDGNSASVDDREAFFESYMSQRNKELAEKRERYFNNMLYAAEEIISTEEAYNKQIRKLGVELKEEARNDPNVAEYFEKGPHGIEVLHDIIYHFEQITRLSDILLEDLKKIYKPPDDARVSGALVKAAKFLTVYNPYVSTHDDLTADLMKAVERNMKLRDFLEGFTRKRSGKGGLFEIKSIMMEPVQRILRYHLLLTEYKKHQDKFLDLTQEKFIDYDDTVEALKVTLKVAQNANVAMLLQDRQKSMDDLVTKVVGIELKDLVTSDRKLIEHEIMIKANRNSYEERLFVLFSDCLMYFIILSENSSYLFKQKLELTFMSVETHKNKEDRELIIKSKDRSLTVICKDNEQQTHWFELIEKTVKEHRDRLTSIGQLEPGVSSLGYTAPVWIRDDTVSACQIPGCDKRFTTFNRYHHCRACGKAICSQCSETAYVEYKKRRDRVCLICFEELEKSPKKSSKKIKRYQKEGDIYLIAGSCPSHDINGVLEALCEGTWKTSHYAVYRCILYEYIQKNDIRAISTRPLISWRVKRMTKDVNHRPAEFCFKLEHDNMEDIIFRANSKEDRENWVNVLKEHVMGAPLNIL